VSGKVLIVVLAAAIAASMVVTGPKDLINTYKRAETLREEANTLRKDNRLEEAAKKYEDAIRYYRKVIEFKSPFLNKRASVDPAIDERSRVGIGLCLLALKRYDLAREEFQKALEAPGTDEKILMMKATAQIALGDSYYEEGKYQEAAEAYRKAIQEYSVFDEVVRQAWYSLGWALFKASQWEEAAQAFDKAGTDYPRWEFAPKAFYQEGESYLRAAEANPDFYAKAIEAFQKITANPDRPEYVKDKEVADKAQFRIGQAYYNQGKYELAIPEFQKVIDNYPESDLRADAQYAIAQCYSAMNKFEDAGNAFLLLVSDYPNYEHREEAAFLAGESFRNGSLWDQAVDAYRRYLELYPKGKSTDIAQYWIAYGLSELSRFEEAITEYEKLVENYPESSVREHGLYNIAFIYDSKLKQLENALKAYGRYIELYPNGEFAGDAMLRIGGIYAEQAKEAKDAGDEAKAAELYNKAIEEYKKTIEKFKDVADRAVTVSDAYYYMGVAYQDGLSKIDEAMEAFMHVKGPGANFDDAQRRIAEYYAKTDVEKAVQIYRTLIEASSDPAYKAYAMVQIGDLYANHKPPMYEKAIEAFSQLIEKFPDSEAVPYASFKIAYSYYGMGEEELKKEELKEKALEHLKKAVEGFDAVLGKVEKEAEYRSFSLYYKAMALKLLGEKEKAIEILRALRNDPATDPKMRDTIMLDISDIFASMGRLEEAAEVYRDLVNNQSIEKELRAEAQYKIGEFYLEKLKDPEKAAVEFAKVAELFPDVSTAPVALYQAGYAMYNQKKYDEAIAYYERILKDYPDSDVVEEAWYNIGLALHDQGKHKEAVERLRAYIERYPEGKNVSAAWYTIGLSCKAMGDKEGVAEAFEKILTDPQYSSSVAGDLALIYIEKNKAEEAVKAIQKILESNVDEATKAAALYSLGDTYMNTENYEKAINTYQRVVNEYPSSDLVPDSLYQIGQAYEKEKKLQMAIEFYRKAIDASNRIKPDSDIPLHAQYNIAKLYKELKDEKRAIEEFKKLTTMDVKGKVEFLESALGELIDMYMDAKNYNEAIKVCQNAFEVAKEKDVKAAILAKLGYAYASQSKYKEAIAVYQRIIDEFPDSQSVADARYWIGDAYMKQETQEGFKKAVAAFRDFISKHPDNRNVIYAKMSIAYAYYRLLNFDEAIKAFQDVIASAPKDEEGVRMAAEAQFMIGECFYQKAIRPGKKDPKVLDLAADAYEKALRYPRAAGWGDDALFSLAWVYQQKRDFEKAEAVLRRLLREYPDSDFAPKAQFTIGDFLYNKKKWPEARAAYQEVVRRWGKSEDPTIKGLVSKAQEVIKETYDLEAKEIYDRATIIHDKKNYDRAIELYKLVEEKYPMSVLAPAAAVNIGVAYEARAVEEDKKAPGTGRPYWEKAIAQYEAVIKKYEKSTDPEAQGAVEHARKEIELIKKYLRGEIKAK
jgi:tetratricopeptide (TPR) repeat protein